MGYSILKSFNLKTKNCLQVLGLDRKLEQRLIFVLNKLIIKFFLKVLTIIVKEPYANLGKWGFTKRPKLQQFFGIKMLQSEQETDNNP